MEPVLEVAVEHERRPGARGGLPGDLAHVVLDAVVVDGLRAVGVAGADLQLVEAPAAGGAEEPQLVLLDRAAERRAPVVGDVHRIAGRAGLGAGLQAEAHAQIIIDVLALQAVVHEVEVVVAREAVAARLRDHVHVDARDIALRGARRRLHVVLLVHLEAVVLHRGAAAAAGPVGLEAVDRERLLAVGRAERLEVVLLHAFGAADVEAAGDDARHEAGHDPRIAAGGDGFVEVLADVGLRHGGRHVHDRRFTADRDGFLQTAHTELHVEAGRAVHLHGDAFAGLRGEPGQVEGHRVAAGRQAGDGIQPLVGADG